MLLRKQFLISEAQRDYLRSLSEVTGQSEGHIVREAIDQHAKQLNLSDIPGLQYELPNQEKTSYEPESERRQEGP